MQHEIVISVKLRLCIDTLCSNIIKDGDEMVVI